MGDEMPCRESFAACHAELERLAGEQGWKDLAGKPRLAELFAEEVRIAEESENGDLLWRTSLDADDFAEEFYILLGRMTDLSADDRDWLMRNLCAEANKAEPKGGTS